MEKTVWAVGGGKGGTGKSFVSCSLGLALASRGNDVLLMDVDLGAPNLHTFLGTGEFHPDLGDFLINRIPSLNDAARPTGFGGLKLIRGTDNILFVSNLNHYKKLKILRQIKTLEAQRTILDIGTGSSFNSLDFFISADPGILVITPEPTAIENGYYFLKSCIMRILKLYMEHYKIQNLLQKLMEQIEKNSHSLYGFFQNLVDSDKTYGHVLYRALKNFKPCLVVNKTRTEKDDLLGQSIADVVKKYLIIDLHYLGAIPYDSRVYWSFRKMTPFFVEHPQSEAAQAIKGIAERLLSRNAAPRAAAFDSSIEI